MQKQSTAKLKHGILMALLAFGFMAVIGLAAPQLAVPALTAETAFAIAIGVIIGTITVAHTKFKLVYEAGLAAFVATGLSVLLYAMMGLAYSGGLAISEFIGVAITVLGYQYLSGSKKKSMITV